MHDVHITLVEARVEDKTLMRNLMQLYQYDVSEFNGQEPDLHGCFEYNYLDQYWTNGGREEGRVPFLVLADGRVAGFILKYSLSWRDDPKTEHFVAEFFIMRKWRRRGMGRMAVAELFRRFPGQWEVSQEPENLVAQRFWRQVIGEITGGQYQEVNDCPNWSGPIQVFTISATSE